MAKHIKRNDKSYIVKQFKNIDEEEFVGMYGGQEYRLGAGKSIALSEFLAVHLARQLAYKMIMRENLEIEEASLERGDKNVKTKLVEEEPLAALAKSMISNVVLPEVEEEKVKKKEKLEEGEKEEEFEDAKGEPEAGDKPVEEAGKKEKPEPKKKKK